MFEKIDSSKIGNDLLINIDYIVMGQICIDKRFRGKGLFRKLYNNLVLNSKGIYKYLITEVSLRNKRSLDAHYAYGFKSLCTYSVEGGDDWDILYLKL